MNATLGGANLLPSLNLLPGENLHSGANCAHEQRLSLSYNYLAGSLINAATYKCADSPEGYGAFLRLFVCCCCCLFLAHLSQRLIGELIVYRSSRHLCVRASVRACVR